MIFFFFLIIIIVIIIIIIIIIFLLYLLIHAIKRCYRITEYSFNNVTTYPTRNFSPKMYCTSASRQNYKSWTSDILMTYNYFIHNRNFGIMHLQLLELLQNSSFVKKLLREEKKNMTAFFSRTSEKAHGCRYTLVVYGLQIMLVRLSALVPAWPTKDLNNSPV